MDTDVIDAPPVTNDGSDVLTYTPDKAGTVWTTYDFPFGLTVGGGVRYGGEMKRGTDGAPGTPEFVTSHTVWDLVASYAFSKAFDLRLNAYNMSTSRASCRERECHHSTSSMVAVPL